MRYCWPPTCRSQRGWLLWLHMCTVQGVKNILFLKRSNSRHTKQKKNECTKVQNPRHHPHKKRKKQQLALYPGLFPPVLKIEGPEYEASVSLPTFFSGLFSLLLSSSPVLSLSCCFLAARSWVWMAKGYKSTCMWTCVWWTCVCDDPYLQ